MTPRIDFDHVRTLAQHNALAICRRVLPGGRVVGGEYEVRNPKRPDRSPGSFRVNLRTGRWADFATDDRGGDAVSLLAYLRGLSQAEAARQLARELGVRS